MAVFDALLGIREGLIGSPASTQISRKHIYFTRPTKNNDIILFSTSCSQVLAPEFWLSGSFKPNNLNAGGSAACKQKNLLLEVAIVTHVVTCQGRDRL